MASSTFRPFVTGALGLFAILSFFGGIIAGFVLQDVIGLIIALQGMLFAVLLSALIVLIDQLTDIRKSMKHQEKMVPSVLGTINNSIQSFQAAYQQKTTEVELVDDTEDNGD